MPNFKNFLVPIFFRASILIGPILRYRPVHNLGETSEQQKIKLQERMSGEKQHPELGAAKVSSRHKFRRAKREPIDPVEERKFCEKMAPVANNNCS